MSRTSGVLGCAEVLLDRKLLDGELVDTEMVTSYRSSRDGLDIVDAALACADALRVQSSVLSRAGAPGEPRELLISQNGHAMLVVPHPCDADRLVVSAVEGRDSDINLALHKLRSLLTSRS